MQTFQSPVARCPWCLCNEKMIKYHDEEWGIPMFDDRKQFEFLTMEVMQCGLNWNMMIQKREIFRVCFDDFDYRKIAEYDESKIEEILAFDGMIRSRRKIEAVIGNAVCFEKIRQEYGSFSDYLWEYSGGKTILYAGRKEGKIPSKNRLSDMISRDLKQRGFRFLGSITVYSHLQACGIINDHIESCFQYQSIVRQYPTVEKYCRDKN